jgi:translation initiation factor IF-3
VLRDRQVRLINSDNEQVGIIPVETALQMAEREGLDLVVVTEESDPPVCRIMNFGKFIYRKNKRVKDQRKKQHSQKNKEIKFHPTIDPHDYQIKLKRIREFLEKSYKVKISMVFRGREMNNTEHGMTMMLKIVADLADVGIVELQPKMFGRHITMFMGPRAI